jgi:hypothetical protein
MAVETARLQRTEPPEVAVMPGANTPLRKTSPVAECTSSKLLALLGMNGFNGGGCTLAELIIAAPEPVLKYRELVVAGYV